MARRKKFVKVSKVRRYRTRAYKRRFTRRRRAYGKRTRRRRYHMARKRRNLAKTYGLRKYAGIKWTRYLSLAEFLGDDKWDLQWLYTVDSRPNHILYTKNGVGCYASDSLVAFGNLQTRLQYTILSTDLWSNKTMQAPSNYQQYIYWKAYSPFPHAHNLGPLFNIYSTQYKKMKYVGMKVKWIPGFQKTTTFHPTTIGETNVQALAQPVAPYQLSAAVQGGTAYTLYPNAKLTTTTTSPEAHTFNVADEDHIHVSFTDGTGFETKPLLSIYPVTVPQLRLWINFDKQGYEGQEFKTNCVQGVTLVTNDVNFRNSRIRVARVFNRDGFKISMSDKLIKSYSLMKSFKFFVRPKMALRFQENIENETVLTNAEPTSTIIDSRIEASAIEANSYVQTGKKMPYLSVMSTSPSGSLVSAPWDTASQSNTAIQILRTMKSDGYFDPILFGWGLSCDDLDINEQLDYFRFKRNFPFDAENGYNHCYSVITDPEDYKNYGKFKVTYYCRFKEFNPLQNVLVKTTQQAENAVLETDVAQLPTQ